MTGAQPSPEGPKPNPLRSMPGVLCFDADHAAKQALAGMQRYARLQQADLPEREAETIVVLSSERLLAENVYALRARNVRVLAISERRFKDPRLDGAVYAYLPPGTPAGLIERMLDNAVDHIHLLHSRRDVNDRLADATREIHELNAIGAALSAEHDTEKLLNMILTKSREITRSDAGSLYLVEEVPLVGEATVEETAPAPEFGGAKLVVTRPETTKKVLRFKLAQNDSAAAAFRELVMDISDRSIAGYVAKTGEIVNQEDVYRLVEAPYSFNRAIDDESGYRTKSMLAVPMRNANGEIVGVVQLINAKREWQSRLTSASEVAAQVVPYTERQQEMIASLASQAAVALDNSRLYQKQRELFDGFVKGAVTAIELRDPTTCGHSSRVMNLTVALAETVDRASDGIYAGVRFTRDQMKEIRYASLLHDVGKVSVPEKVLVKAKKLYPEQLELVRQRFGFVKRSLQAESLQKKLAFVLAHGSAAYAEKLRQMDGEFAAQIKEVDACYQTVLQSNEPSVLPAGNFEKLAEIAARHFLDCDGEEQALLEPQEVRLLSIRKGSLDESERLEIESHVKHTFYFLSQIPWTKEIRNIPEIARSHHEKLTGRGYPNKLGAPEIPLQTRMMTISDIFDALAASDRPYKAAVSTERALEILALEEKDGNIDPNLFRMFVEAKVWERWKTEPFAY